MKMWPSSSAHRAPNQSPKGQSSGAPIPMWFNRSLPLLVNWWSSRDTGISLSLRMSFTKQSVYAVEHEVSAISGGFGHCRDTSRQDVSAFFDTRFAYAMQHVDAAS